MPSRRPVIYTSRELFFSVRSAMCGSWFQPLGHFGFWNFQRTSPRGRLTWNGVIVGYKEP